MRFLLNELLLPLAHQLSFPHEEPTSSSSGPSPLLIAGGVVLTLALLAALIWVKDRMPADDEQRPKSEAQPDA